MINIFNIIPLQVQIVEVFIIFMAKYIFLYLIFRPEYYTIRKKIFQEDL